MGLFHLAELFGMTIRESANDGSDFTNPSADYRRLFLGEDGQLHAKDSAGSVTALSGGGVTVEDEGTPLATTATTLDFVGAGVTATGSGAEKTITIPGGGIGTDYARASSNAGQSISTGAAVAIVDFEDVTFDPGSDITTGASWAYTAPTTGIYRVSCQVAFSATTTWATSERGLLQLFKNGSLAATLDRKDSMSSANVQMFLGGSTTVSLTAGDTIDVRLAQNSGGSLALDGVTDNNYIDIHRIA